MRQIKKLPAGGLRRALTRDCLSVRLGKCYQRDLFLSEWEESIAARLVLTKLFAEHSPVIMAPLFKSAKVLLPNAQRKSSTTSQSIRRHDAEWFTHTHTDLHRCCIKRNTVDRWCILATICILLIFLVRDLAAGSPSSEIALIHPDKLRQNAFSVQDTISNRLPSRCDKTRR